MAPLQQRTQEDRRNSAPSLAEMILIGVLLLFFALSLLHIPAQMLGGAS